LAHFSLVNVGHRWGIQFVLGKLGNEIDFGVSLKGGGESLSKDYQKRIVLQKEKWSIS
jgi:hypothetical protein